jgi:hypothetical protein
MKILFKCIVGSNLHGTALPTSDIDYKIVYMASVRDIILKKDKDNVNKTTGNEDVEHIELRKFLKDVISGQTYAIEMLHIPDSHVITTTPIFEDIIRRKGELITNNVKPFVGYCISQAKKYGLKGKRLKAAEGVLDFLNSTTVTNPHILRRVPILDTDPVWTWSDVLPKNEYVFYTKVFLKGQATPVIMLEICGKRFDTRSPTGVVIQSVTKIIGKYGPRSHDAKDCGNVDWKAIGHAYRIAYELKELLETGSITFPRPEREFLKKVKLGEIPYEQVQDEIPELLDGLPDVDATEVDMDKWNEMIYNTYLTELIKDRVMEILEERKESCV